MIITISLSQSIPDKPSAHDERERKLEAILSSLGACLMRSPQNDELARLYRQVVDLLHAAEGAKR